VLNFIHRYWPSLLKIPGFLKEFITPIIKATHKKTKTKKEVFFNMPEYQQWMEKIGDDIKQYHVKYYKGLGTSTAAEAKEVIYIFFDV
jgi:DNA topoisomerase II